MWRANGNPNPCTDLDEILHPHPHVSKEGFGAGLTPTPSSAWAWRPKISKTKGNIFEKRLQNKRCSAGCKLTRGQRRVPQQVEYNNGVPFC